MARFAAQTVGQTAASMAAGAAIAGAAVLGVGAAERMMQQPQAQAPTAPPQQPPTPTGTNSGWVRTLQQRGLLK